tara:strand:+ start:164 stop:553 length:390 start_codon:yes stop_codon:yes gene_type:complete
MATLLYYRQCDSCESGMSRGYIMHGGEYYFCNDDCISKFWGRKKVFTTLEDWNNNGSGLTWKQFQDSWDKLDDNSYEYDWQLDICSYTEWADGCELDSVYDSKGKEYIIKDVQNNKKYLIVNGENDDLH